MNETRDPCINMKLNLNEHSKNIQVFLFMSENTPHHEFIIHHAYNHLSFGHIFFAYNKNNAMKGHDTSGGIETRMIT